MTSLPPPHYLVVGALKRLFLITPAGRPYMDVPGGNLLYAASSLALWENSIGLVSRVGEDYPRAWLEDFQQHNLNTAGVKVLPDTIDLRQFIAYSDLHTRHTRNPVAHFARLGIEFPKALLGYRVRDNHLEGLQTLAPLSIRQSDLPPDFLHATIAHFCPYDYVTHSLMPAVLRQAGFTTITLNPGRQYMDPYFWDRVPALITGLTAFLPSEEKVRALFKGRSNDLWEMAETLGSYGCEIIVIKRGIQGQLLYDAQSKTRWEIPAYPSRDADPTGVGNAFCGGFLAGYRRTYDPVAAVLYGNVAASLAIEGTGPFYISNVLPGLAEARLEVIRQSVRKI